MKEVLLRTVGALLAKSEVKQALDLMRTWLATATPGDPEELLALCTPDIKPKVALLLRDLLSRYPHTLLGVPVLVYYKSEEDTHLQLAAPTIDSAYPCQDLQFLGWTSYQAQLPLPQPFRYSRRDVCVPVNQMTAVVALFKSHPNVFDYDELILPDSWWAYLFQERDGNSVHISARVLLPYPDAIEYTRAMECYLHDKTVLPSEYHFIGPDHLDWTKQAVHLFKDSCLHQ